MLRLLAQREQGYEDIAALMGLSVDEVRAKVKEALAEVDESGEAVAEVAAEAPETPAVEAEKPVEKPAVEPPRPATPPPPAAKPSPPSRPRIRLPKDQRLLAGGVAGIVAIALILILALGGGGSSSSSSPTTATAPTGSTNTTASSQKLTEAVLSPVDGGNASGRALFGRVKSTVVLQIEASGLDPSPQGQSYTVWLYKSPKLRLPLAATKVGKSGRLAGQYPVPAEVLAYLASGAFDQIDVSLTKDSTFAASLAKAKKQKSAPEYTGTDILRGTVTGPIAEAKK
jgi:hypothetical protein